MSKLKRYGMYTSSGMINHEGLDDYNAENGAWCKSEEVAELEEWNARCIDEKLKAQARVKELEAELKQLKSLLHDLRESAQHQKPGESIVPTSLLFGGRR